MAHTQESGSRVHNRICAWRINAAAAYGYSWKFINWVLLIRNTNNKSKNENAFRVIRVY